MFTAAIVAASIAGYLLVAWMFACVFHNQILERVWWDCGKSGDTVNSLACAFLWPFIFPVAVPLFGGALERREQKIEKRRALEERKIVEARKLLQEAGLDLE